MPHAAKIPLVTSDMIIVSPFLGLTTSAGFLFLVTKLNQATILNLVNKENGLNAPSKITAN
jgi:hypothetical protein